MKCTHEVATKEYYSIGKELHKKKNIYLLQGSHWYFTNTHISPIKKQSIPDHVSFPLTHPITNHCCYYPGWTRQISSNFHSQNNETENPMISINISSQAAVSELWQSSAQTPASARCVESGTGLHGMSWGSLEHTLLRSVGSPNTARGTARPCWHPGAAEPFWSTLWAVPDGGG